MSKLSCKFEVVEPEFEDAHVTKPQVNVFHCSNDRILVVVYFMAAFGIDQMDGSANSALGTVTLKCEGRSTSGAVASSTRMQKACYTFESAQGMARNFVFDYTTT